VDFWGEVDAVLMVLYVCNVIPVDVEMLDIPNLLFPYGISSISTSTGITLQTYNTIKTASTSPQKSTSDHLLFT
jgi:hypothetical protein